MAKNRKLPSLRKRYLTIASLVISLLLVGAGTASWYIRNITSNNLSALEFNKSVIATTQQLHHSLSLISITINAMLITPEASHESIINKNMDQALQLISALQSNLQPETINLERPVNNLYFFFGELKDKVQHLTRKRKDPSWVYPALPFINSKLLTPNNNFIASVESSINGYHIEGIAFDTTYHQLQELRNLWQKKILNFRAVIIRFAGLNNTSKMSQEIIISKLQTDIDNSLLSLTNNELELHVEAYIPIMKKASKEWSSQWRKMKKLRNSNAWRKDIAFLKKEIIPLQENINFAMEELEISSHDLSQKQIESLSNAAKNIIAEIWLLTLLAISFVFIVYLMIERLVLRPIYRIEQSLTMGSGEHHSHIEDYTSKEINQLASAFNTMQTQIQQRQIALEHQAMHDALTNLPNRLLFNDRLAQAINLMHRTKGKLAVLLLDLDRFKDVNDTLGHHIGDQLLIEAAARLQGSIRSSDTVARLGGDEFAIIAPQTTAHEALEFANKIVSALTNVFTLEHNNIYVGVSIGISIYPENGTDNNTLIRHADTAMYGAKYNNQDALLYLASQDKNTPDKLSLVNDLHHAIENKNEFSIHYQPQIDLLTNKIIKVEALLRWNHPSQGFIPTEKVIDLAEKTGVIQQLTIWVLNTAIEEFMRYLFEKNIGLSINLSMWNLQDPDLPSTIYKLLSYHRMPADKLTLEITETAMMNDPVRARSILNELNEMGIILSIDDYGTGFSSLSYLNLLPVHELKIDKSFVFDMLDNENVAIIVKSTIELAHNLGYKVIAEGVENNETLLELKKLNCDIIQGYFIAKPISIDQLVIWLIKHEPLTI
jgi:diguanylate cyclase (GGDEF)-like protein